MRAWQTWLHGQGIPSFPLYGIMNGACRCSTVDCRTPGKHPKIKGWRTITDPVEPGPLDNLGVSTDRLVVVDIDSADSPPSDLPETFTVSTGRGLHLWYWANPEHPISNSVGWRPKIDIRSNGGLVAAPTSRHASGTEYVYVGGEIQPVPEVVYSTQRRFERREKADQVTSIPSGTQAFIQPTIELLCDDVRNAPQGQRNHILFRCLCRFFELAQTGWAGEDALHQLMDAAKANGLTVSEIANTIQSASCSLTR